MNKKEIEYQIRKRNLFYRLGWIQISIKSLIFKRNEDPLFEFNKAIIDSTNKFCVWL